MNSFQLKLNYNLTERDLTVNKQFHLQLTRITLLWNCSEGQRWRLGAIWLHFPCWSRTPVTSVIYFSQSVAPCVLRGCKNRDPLRFLAGCHTRRLNQALSVRSLNLDFLSVSVVLLIRVPFCIMLFCFICVFCLLVVLVRLSVPVQVIDWKDSAPKWPIMCWWGR